MRTLLLATTLLAAAATAAHADPSGYVETGAMAGANDDLLTLGVTFDAGYHFANTPFWAHARFATGTGGELFATGTGSFLQVRAGVESRTCGFGGALCGMVGVDFGFQHTQFTGHDDLWFGEDNTTPSDMTTVADHAIVVPRIGLDLGSRSLRVRPSLELDMGPTGVDGANATLAVAFQW